jgi:hypothetical protein
MKKITTLFISLFFLLFFLVETSKAQNQLVVSLNNNTTETFLVSRIRTIKFGTNTMNLIETNGTSTTWDISTIQQYSFIQPSSVETTPNYSDLLIEIFPNPTTDRFNVICTSDRNQPISMEILDITGKVIKCVYKGYQESGKYEYNFTVSLSAGNYFCRINTETKSMIKPLIIK